MHKNTKLLCLLGIGLTSLLYGNPEHFSVIAPYGAPLLDEVGFLNDDGSFQELKWSRQKRSKEYPAPRSGAVELVKPVIDSENGKITYQPVKKLDWPGEAQDALYVFICVDGKPIQVLTINDDKEVFPTETLKIVNALQTPIDVKAGSSQLHLNAGKFSKPVQTEDYFQEDEDSPNPGMPIAVFMLSPEDPKIIYAASFSVYPKRRALGLVLPPMRAHSDRYQVRLIND